MRQWLDGDRHAREPSDPGPPDAGAAQHRLAGDPPLGRVDRVHASSADVEAGDLDPAVETGSALRRRARHGLDPADTLGDPVVGDVQATVDPGGVDDRDALGDLAGSDQLGLDAPGVREAALAGEVPPARAGDGDLDAPHGVVARLAVEVEAGVQRDGGGRELGHRLGRVGLEHQPGGVRGGATGRPQRPLVDDDDVGAPELGQVVSGAGAHDPSPDHHDKRA